MFSAMTKSGSVSLAALLFAASCADVAGPPDVSQDDIVPAREIAAMWAQTPYECVAYRAASESCEVQIRYERQGSRYLGFGQGALSAKPPITFDMSLGTRIKGDRFCARSDELNVAISGADPGLTRELTQIVRAEYAPLGEICSTYYRTGDGRYVTIARDETGRVIPEGVTVSRFFAEPRALRLPAF